MFAPYLSNENESMQPLQARQLQKEIYRSMTFFEQHAVDGQNPAPPRMMIIPLFIGF